MIKINDTITYRPSFGMGAPKTVQIEHMELCDQPRSKYGKSVTTVTVDDIKRNMVMFDLSDGHWCYSDQIVLPRKGK